MEVRPGYKQTEVGLIPEDWFACELRELSKIITGPFGTLLKATEYTDGDGVPQISVGEIRDGYFRIGQSTPRIPKEVTRRIPQYLLRANDVVFGRKGAVERSSLVTDKEDGWFLGSDGICVRPIAGHQPEYLAAQLRSPLVKSWLLQNSIGTTMPSLNQSILGRVLVTIAPIAEQRAIATALSDMDALLDGLDRLIAKKRAIKQAVIQQLLAVQIRLPGFSGEWEVKTLGDVVKRFVGGGTPSRANPAYWRNEIPWVTVKDFATFNPFQAQEGITRLGLCDSASNLIPAGTLITSTRMALGKAVVYQVDVAINQDMKALFLNSNVTVDFLFHWFACYGERIDDIGSGSTVKGISVNELKRLEISFPKKNEQTAIATVLTDMDAEIIALETRRTKTRALKQAMMQELLTGRTRLI